MGLWDDVTSAGEDAYGTVAGTADHLAGSTDEAVARQFDDEEGGGFADYDTWAGLADHAAGSTDEWVGGQTGGDSDTSDEDPLADLYEYEEGETPGSARDSHLDSTDADDLNDDTREALAELDGSDGSDSGEDFSVTDEDAIPLPTFGGGGGGSSASDSSQSGLSGMEMGALVVAALAVAVALRGG